MGMTVHCDVVSAETKIYSGLVEMLIAAGSEGDLGIAPGHTPLLTQLKPGLFGLSSRAVRKKFFTCPAGIWKSSPIW